MNFDQKDLREMFAPGSLLLIHSELYKFSNSAGGAYYQLQSVSVFPALILESDFTIVNDVQDPVIISLVRTIHHQENIPMNYFDFIYSAGYETPTQDYSNGGFAHVFKVINSIKNAT